MHCGQVAAEADAGFGISCKMLNPRQHAKPFVHSQGIIPAWVFCLAHPAWMLYNTANMYMYSTQACHHLHLQGQRLTTSTLCGRPLDLPAGQSRHALLACTDGFSKPSFSTAAPSAMLPSARRSHNCCRAAQLRWQLQMSRRAVPPRFPLLDELTPLACRPLQLRQRMQCRHQALPVTTAHAPCSLVLHDTLAAGPATNAPKNTSPQPACITRGVRRNYLPTFATVSSSTMLPCDGSPLATSSKTPGMAPSLKNSVIPRVPPASKRRVLPTGLTAGATQAKLYVQGQNEPAGSDSACASSATVLPFLPASHLNCSCMPHRTPPITPLVVEPSIVFSCRLALSFAACLIAATSTSDCTFVLLTN